MTKSTSNGSVEINGHITYLLRTFLRHSRKGGRAEKIELGAGPPWSNLSPFTSDEY